MIKTGRHCPVIALMSVPITLVDAWDSREILEFASTCVMDLFSNDLLTNKAEFEGGKRSSHTRWYVPVVSKVSVRLEISCSAAIVLLLMLDHDLRTEVFMQFQNMHGRWKYDTDRCVWVSGSGLKSQHTLNTKPCRKLIVPCYFKEISITLFNIVRVGQIGWLCFIWQ